MAKTTMVNFWSHSGGTDRHAQISGPALASRAGKGKAISPNLWPAGRFRKASNCGVSHD
jgi:hypothetical protein